MITPDPGRGFNHWALAPVDRVGTEPRGAAKF